MILTDEPLPAEEREHLLDDLAGAVARRGLQTPAILALEMHRPLAFTLSQGLIAFGPLFGPLLGIERMQRAARLLGEPGAVDALIRRIEETEPERSSGKG